MPKATCITNSEVVKGRWIVQRVVWALPKTSVERPHGLKYPLFCGNAKQCLVRYDNEAGKGGHRHYGEREEPYVFSILGNLLIDFQNDA